MCACVRTKHNKELPSFHLTVPNVTVPNVTVPNVTVLNAPVQNVVVHSWRASVQTVFVVWTEPEECVVCSERTVVGRCRLVNSS